MRVLIVAVGSRGGCDALDCAGDGAARRRSQRDDRRFGFRAFPGDPRPLEAARWRRGGTRPIGAVRLIRLIADHMRELNQGILAAARRGADVLLLQGISSIGGYHIAEGLGLPSMGLALQPVNPTSEFPPSIVTARSLGRLGNRAAGQALVAMGAPALAGLVKELRAELGLPRLP
jgi:sterol 3beta-glucosyltransferase